MTPLQTFARSLKRDDIIRYLGESVIGDGVEVPGPLGAHKLIYADYVASGRALTPIEDFIRDSVLPYYANSHTEASFCGAFCTKLREEARQEISRITHAGTDCSTIFTGSGATAGLNRLVGLLMIPELVRSGRKVVVLVGPYEHHSNILPWRESGADVIEIAEAAAGGPDLKLLSETLSSMEDDTFVIGSFSAASNVTGILTDTDAVTRILKHHNAVAIWDFAGGAPYLPVDMGSEDCAKDAIVYSSHKFPGGPGASGILIVRNQSITCEKPTAPGGGTVSFVSPWSHTYSCNPSTREEAGTPNVVGDIRAALVMLVKEAIGQDYISQRDAENRNRAKAVWAQNPQIELLGNEVAAALPIFAFRIRDANGELLHHQLFTRMLSDHFGIQARGGCACAGPYAHRLLGIGRAESEALFGRLNEGAELEKPGWVRLNFSYLMTDQKVDFIINAVDELARNCCELAAGYVANPKTARFRPREAATSTDATMPTVA